MSIVDLSYINEECEVDNLMILVDSEQRDITKYKTTSEYVVEFNEPIRLVNGLEVLDASIPNTATIINERNNEFSFTFLFPPIKQLDEDELLIISGHKHPRINKKDAMINHFYKTLLMNFFDELSYNKEFSKVFYYFEQESIFKDYYHQIVLTTNDQFNHFGYDKLDLSRQKPMKMDNNSTQIFIQNQIKLRRLRKVNNEASHKKTKNSTFLTFDDSLFYVEFAKEFKDFTFDEMQSIDLKQYYLDEENQKFLYYLSLWTTEQETLQSIILPISQLLQSPNEKLETIVLFNTNTVFDEANYEFISQEEGSTFSTEIIKKMNNALDRYTSIVNLVQFHQSEKFDIQTSKAARRYTYHSDVPFMFYGTKSSMGAIIGLVYYRDGDRLYTKLNYAKDEFIFMSRLYDEYNLEKDIDKGRFIIIPDGLIGLRTAPYVMLRAKEIEDQIYRTYPYGKQGFASFKLLSSNQTSHLRFDFTNFIKKKKKKNLSIQSVNYLGSLYVLNIQMVLCLILKVLTICCYYL